jgi:hypothetical protein
MAAATAEPSPDAKAEMETQLRRWSEARQKLVVAQDNARNDLRQALISGTMRAAAVREDGNLVTMQPARWRMLFERPLSGSLQPFAEAVAGRTVPLTATADGKPTAWGRAIIASADLARWCGGPPEAEPAERPTDWPVPSPPAPVMTAARSEVTGRIASERRLEKWLTEAMKAEPSNPVSKPEMVQRAGREPGLSVSGRGFERAWASAVKASQAVAWASPGRRKSPR